MARQRSPFWRGIATLAALGLAAFANACAVQPTSPAAGPDPSDPSARSRPIRYRSTIAPYEQQRPVEPKPWQEQNEQVVPRQ